MRAIFNNPENPGYRDMRRFHKAKLFSIKSQHSLVAPEPGVGYLRFANAASLRIWRLEIIWRMPWLKEAAYEQGWDACFRHMRRPK